MKLDAHLRSVKRVTLIEVVILRGEGTDEDPVREVTMLFDDDGRCVAEHDAHYPTPWYAPSKACAETRQRPDLNPDPTLVRGNVGWKLHGGGA